MILSGQSCTSRSTTGGHGLGRAKGPGTTGRYDCRGISRAVSRQALRARGDRAPMTGDDESLGSCSPPRRWPRVVRCRRIISPTAVSRVAARTISGDCSSGESSSLC